MIIDKENLGIVTSDKIYLNHGLNKLDEEGLFSQKIFGPVKPWKCACGNLNSKILHDNKRCEKCGVLCTDPEVRYTTFAKIRLPFPFYKNSKNHRSKFDSVIGKHKSILDPHQTDRNLTGPTKFLELKPSRNKTFIPKVTGTFTHYQSCIPINITGIYSFYLALYAGAYLYNNPKCKEIVETGFSYELLVTPPKTRDVGVQVKKGKKELVMNEINDQYQRILKISNFDWPNVIDPDQAREDFIGKIKSIIDDPDSEGEYLNDIQIHQYDQMISRYQNHINNLYKLTIQSLGTKHGFIRKDFIGRSIDFSARAHIVSDPSLRVYEISVSKQIFIRLWFTEYLYYINIIRNNREKYNELLPYVEFTDMYINLDKLDYVNEFIDWMLTENDNEHNLIVFMNRQPTLWRYGCLAVKVVNVTDTDTIGLSNLTLESYNADFDGDTHALYRIQDINAQKEMQEKAYLRNETQYDHNGNLIQQIRLEGIYPIYLLLTSEINVNEAPVDCNSLKELPVSFDDTLQLRTPIKINGKIYPYGVCLFNKWCDFEEVQISQFSGSKIVSKLIFNDSNGVDEYNNRMHNLSKRMFWYASIHPELALTISLDEFNNLDLEKPKDIIKKLPRNPYIGQHIYKYLQNDVYDRIPNEYKLKALLEIKVNKTQLSRLLCGIGYIADSNNIINSKPISSSIISGLDEETFFETVSGTRKGITDKNEVTPDSGYIERSMVVNLSPIELDMDDCGTHLGLNVEIQNTDHVKSLINKYYVDQNGNLQIYNPPHYESEVGKIYSFRSPICCANSNFKICKTCFGNYNIKSRYVGIIAGQSIAERLTQLTMRTFHTSGSCDLPTDSRIVDIIQHKLKDIIVYKKKTFSTLIFTKLETSEINLLSGIKGYSDIKEYEDETHLIYDDISNVPNRDVTTKIKEVKKLNQFQGKNDLLPIDEVYTKYITNALSVGEIYSTFVEIVLCNMYVTEDGELLRYALQSDYNATPAKKLNVKTLHTIVSKLLGLLYEPNEQSICKFADTNNPLPPTANTVLERFWNEI